MFQLVMLGLHAQIQMNPQHDWLIPTITVDEEVVLELSWALHLD